MFSQEFFSIPSSIIRSGLILDFDLYKCERVDGKDKFELALNESLPVITPETLEELRNNGIDVLHIAAAEADRFRAYLERNIGRILKDNELDERGRARVLYYAAKVYVREWFDNPNLGPALESSIELIHGIIKQIIKGEHAFYNFFDMNGESPYLMSHSLNVAIYGLALMNAMGVSRLDQLEAYAFGALLHDLGMKEVPNEIITKPDRLTPEEYRIVRKHPSTGAKIATEEANLPSPGDAIVGQHHERLDGNGYPWGLPAGEIHPLARLCSVADVFDAMTSKRSYKDPVNTFDAFRTLKLAEGDKFDQEIVDLFIKLMTP